MKIKRILNKKRNSTLKAIGIFFVIVLICTYVSRFASSLLTPQVECEKSSRMQISHDIVTSGAVYVNKELPIYVYPELLVDSVDIHVGDNIEKGSLLLELNMEYLNDLDVNQEIELAELQKERRSLSDRKAIDKRISDLQEKMAQIDNLIELNGCVYAESTGQITGINIVTGSYTTETAAFIYGDISQGYIVESVVSEDDIKYIIAGEKAVVEVGDSKETFEISQVSKSNDSVNSYIVDISVSGDIYKIGMSVQIVFSHSSDMYSCCVPVSAIREGNQQYYVLVMEKKDTILGQVYVAQKAVVTVEESNAYYAAVSSATLKDDARIIISSDKDIEAGDEVRLYGD
jgi:hypothetical protein